MATTVGQVACPECGELQDVYFDTRKYYIKCVSCHTFTHYQSKAAKALIENRLKAQAPVKPESLHVDIPVTKPESKPPPSPARPTESNSSVFDSLNDLF